MCSVDRDWLRIRLGFRAIDWRLSGQALPLYLEICKEKCTHKRQRNRMNQRVDRNSENLTCIRPLIVFPNSSSTAKQLWNPQKLFKYACKSRYPRFKVCLLSFYSVFAYTKEMKCCFSPTYKQCNIDLNTVWLKTHHSNKNKKFLNIPIPNTYSSTFQRWGWIFEKICWRFNVSVLNVKIEPAAVRGQLETTSLALSKGKKVCLSLNHHL